MAVRRRHLTLVSNMLRVTRNPLRALRGVAAGRAAMRAGAQQKLSECAPLYAAVGRPRVIVEIGPGSGGTLAGFARIAAEDAVLISVDDPAGAFGGGTSPDEVRRNAQPRDGQTLHQVLGDSKSEDVLAEVRRLLPGPADVLFIDGDHTYAGVKADYLNYRELVRPGGLIGFHDILPHPGVADCEVDRLWAEIGGRKREIVSPQETRSDLGGTWGGIGIVRAYDNRSAA